MKLTKAQRHALAVLKERHDRFPEQSRFPSVHLGPNVTQALRVIRFSGLVTVSEAHANVRQFFSLTEDGRKLLEDAA